ncbi:ERCC4 domain-containing protein [Dermatophilaceae bacterium Soc4.6]
MRELLIARNPDPESSLGFLMRLPLGDGMVFRTSGTWPREKALYCHPVHLREWPDEPEVVERIAVRSCERRGAAIDLVVDRGREHRSQIVYTTARGRQMVFWQSPKTRKQSKPRVTLPTARAAGLADLQIVVDSHEQYPYRFPGQQVSTERGPLRCGDYGLVVDGELVGSVERKSVTDLVSTISGGRMGFAMGELASLPRAAVVVEERYSALLTQTWMRAATAADAVAELQVRYPNVPIVFCDNRKLAEEWTFRFLGAVRVWWETEQVLVHAVGGTEPTLLTQPRRVASSGDGEPTTAQVRAWARGTGVEVPARGRLRPEVWAAWRAANPPTS